MAALLCRRWGARAPMQKLAEALRGVLTLVSLPLLPAAEASEDETPSTHSEVSPLNNFTSSPRLRKQDLKAHAGEAAVSEHKDSRPGLTSVSPALAAALFFQHKHFLQRPPPLAQSPASRTPRTPREQRMPWVEADSPAAPAARGSLLAEDFGGGSARLLVAQRKGCEEERVAQAAGTELVFSNSQDEDGGEDELEEVELNSRSSGDGDAALPILGAVSLSSGLTAAAPAGEGLPATRSASPGKRCDAVAASVLQEANKAQLRDLLVAEAKLQRAVSGQLQSLLMLHHPEAALRLREMGVDVLTALGDFLVTGFAAWCYLPSSKERGLSLEQREAAVEVLWKFLALFGEPRA